LDLSTVDLDIIKKSLRAGVPKLVEFFSSQPVADALPYGNRLEFRVDDDHLNVWVLLNKLPLNEDDEVVEVRLLPAIVEGTPAELVWLRIKQKDILVSMDPETVVKLLDDLTMP
jgi:hypothetical protein